MSKEKTFLCVRCARFWHEKGGRVISGADNRICVCSQCYSDLGGDLSNLKLPAPSPKVEPTKLTRDQAIRAKALELAIATSAADAEVRPEGFDNIMELSDFFEDYIRDGRKGDE